MAISSSPFHEQKHTTVRSQEQPDVGVRRAARYAELRTIAGAKDDADQVSGARFGLHTSAVHKCEGANS
jgi:hypothetical protein